MFKKYEKKNFSINTKRGEKRMKRRLFFTEKRQKICVIPIIKKRLISFTKMEMGISIPSPLSSLGCFKAKYSTHTDVFELAIDIPTA